MLFTANSFVPSADEATELHVVIGALVCIQVWANAGFTIANRPQKIIRADSMVFIWRL
jgi:hypothetical protein